MGRKKEVVVVQTKKLIAKGRGKVSRKALNISILSFIVSAGAVAITIAVPTITLPTWLFMLPLGVGFGLLAYDSLK